MSATADSFTKKHYAFLGKLFIQKEPELAGKLISQYLPKCSPAETDHAKIKTLYITFCDIQNLNPDHYLGPLHKTSKVAVRRQFIAVILHLYCPQVFLHTYDNFILTRGLATQLSTILKQSRNHMSMAIREVIFWEKRYDDFSSSVATIIEKMTNDGSAEG